MNLREKLIEFMSRLVSIGFPINKDFEFDVTLENHDVNNSNIYRLRYINYHRIGEGYGMGPNNIGLIDWMSKPFMFPQNMNREDGFLFLSYLTNLIEKDYDLEEGSLTTNLILENALSLLEKEGFSLVHEEDESKIVDLFTIDGRGLLFKNSSLYLKYFDWYTENVSDEEIQRILFENQIDLDSVELVKDSASDKVLSLIK